MGILANRPVLRRLGQLLFSAGGTDIARYADGTVEEVSYDIGLLRKPQIITAMATFLVTTFHLTIDASIVTDIILNLVSAIGGIATVALAGHASATSNQVVRTETT